MNTDCSGLRCIEVVFVVRSCATSESWYQSRSETFAVLTSMEHAPLCERKTRQYDAVVAKSQVHVARSFQKLGCYSDISSRMQPHHTLAEQALDNIRIKSLSLKHTAGTTSFPIPLSHSEHIGRVLAATCRACASGARSKEEVRRVFRYRKLHRGELIRPRSVRNIVMLGRIHQIQTIMYVEGARFIVVCAHLW